MRRLRWHADDKVRDLPDLPRVWINERGVFVTRNYEHAGKRADVPILIVLLRWFEGKKLGDIATEVNRHPETVKTMCRELGLRRRATR